MASSKVSRSQHGRELEDQAHSGVRGRTAGEERNLSTVTPSRLPDYHATAHVRCSDGFRMPRVAWHSPSPRSAPGLLTSFNEYPHREAQAPRAGAEHPSPRRRGEGQQTQIGIFAAFGNHLSSFASVSHRRVAHAVLLPLAPLRGEGSRSRRRASIVAARKLAAARWCYTRQSLGVAIAA